MAYLRDLRINLRGFTWTYVDLRYFGGLTWIYLDWDLYKFTGFTGFTWISVVQKCLTYKNRYKIAHLPLTYGHFI